MIDEPGSGERIGLALGGGAARGLAHLGVLEVLDAEGIRPSVIAGTSFGALVGAAVLAREGDVASVIRSVVGYVHGHAFRRSQLNFFRRGKDIERTGLLYNLRDLVKRGIYYGFSMTRASFVPPEEFRSSIDAIVPERDIASLPIRFGAVAADIHSGEEVVLDRGSLRVAVRASCAIPGVMPPVKLASGRVLIDGGWVNKVPVEPTRALGADLVIAVDVSDDLADTVDLTQGLNVIMRGDAIKGHRLKMLQLTRADLVIHCPVASIHWADFSRAEEIIDLGRQSAREALPALRALAERAAGKGSLLRWAAEHAPLRFGGERRRRPEVVRAEAKAEDDAPRDWPSHDPTTEGR